MARITHKTILDAIYRVEQTLLEIMKNSFDHVDQRFVEVGKRFDKVENRLEDLEVSHIELLNGQQELVRGQEDIKLRLDQHAYKFETKDLDKRVSKIERKIGI